MAYIARRTYPNLKTWRSERGISQHEAARLLGISQTYYNRLERGLTVATWGTAKRILQITGVPLETIVGLA